MHEHPLRRQIVGEMHLRRWPAVAAPATIVQMLRQVAPEQRAAEAAHLAQVAAALPEGARHAMGQLAPGLAYVWERHAEASGITLFAQEGADPAAGLAWLAGFPGAVVRATRIRVVSGEAQVAAALAGAGFLASDLVSCGIGPEGCRLWSDFRIGADGFGQLVVDVPEAPAQAAARQGHDVARLLQTLQDLGNYRNLALLGLPLARAHWPRLDGVEEALRQLAGDVGRADLTDDALLEKVCAISLELMSIGAETRYRLSATRAYARLVEERLGQLAVRPIAGYPSLEDFTHRRFLPAVRTCSAFDRRLGELTARGAQFTALLRTRVETRIENQNGQLLRSMEQSASLQLRLQQLVEGLSVVALSYYALALVGYVLKGVEEVAPHFPAVAAEGALVPVVVACVWLGLHRMKARLLGGH